MSSAAAPSLPETVVLVLEDNPGDARLVKHYLGEIRHHRYIVEHCQRVEAARSLIASRIPKPDIVLMDRHLPDGDGLEFLRELAADADIPAIMLTGDAAHDTDLAAMRHGASDFLNKSELSGSVLDRSIRYALESRRHRDELKSALDKLQTANMKLNRQAARIEAEVANVFNLAEHLAKPHDRIEMNSHPLGGANSGYDDVVENCAVGIWHILPDGTTLKTNTAMVQFVGVDPGELHLYEEFAALFSDNDRRRAERELTVWTSGMTSSYETRLTHPISEKPLNLAISGCPVLDDQGRVTSIIITVVDLTERRRTENTTRRQAQTDPLTALLNRNAFLDVLPGTHAINRRNGTQIALLYFDLDRFKLVNDTLGHQTGDDVLRKVAERVKSCIRSSDFAARIGGDEFAVALNNIQSPMGAAQVAQNLLQAISAPILLDGRSIDVGVSIGITMLEDASIDPEECLKSADMALYECKRSGGNAFQFFDPEMLVAVEDRKRFDTDLARAPEDQALELYYQPQIDIWTGEVKGLEALLRWNRPEFGYVEPGTFIPFAEESGAIVDLGRWVAETACREMAIFGAPIPVSINVSAMELRQPSFTDDLARLVHDSGIQPERLAIEVTESAIMDDLDRSARVIGDIRALGVRVALDDFGTGYSSLTLLKSLKVDTLKIDGSFIQNICTNPVDAAIVKSVIEMGERMHLRVVAERIEDADQVDKLKELGGQEAQGYYYCRPQPANRIAEFCSVAPTPKDVIVTALGVR